jgi:hypothetical protein
MTYKYLDPAENVGLPSPVPYAGLYSDAPYSQNKWSKDYRGPQIPPDAVAYSQQYFELARYHIPTASRPGNNTVLNNPYRFTYNNNYNTLCTSI